MNDIIICDLWDENDGIYIQIDESIGLSSEDYKKIFSNLINKLGYDESSTYELFYPCEEPSWSDLADVREEVTKVITDLGYRVEWL